MRIAAIGIGSNSLRMLLADISEGKMHRLHRFREGLRVFAALDEQKRISSEMMRKACESVAGFRKEAEAAGAEVVHLFATSAVRDAANQQEFAQALLEHTGLALDVCSGEKEARLSFLGAMEKGPTGVIDIGGGSTELVVGDEKGVSTAASVQMGAVRLFRQLPLSSVQEARTVVECAKGLLRPVLPQFAKSQPEQWIGVGGTFTTTAALVQQIPWSQKGSIHGFQLSRQCVWHSIEQLAPMPLKQRYELPWLQPQRADIVVHGMAILTACMEELKIDCIQVSEYGNLEGYLKEKYLL